VICRQKGKEEKRSRKLLNGDRGAKKKEKCPFELYDSIKEKKSDTTSVG